MGVGCLLPLRQDLGTPGRGVQIPQSSRSPCTTWALGPPRGQESQGVRRLWGPWVRVRLSPGLGAQGRQSQEALGSERSCSPCSPLSHLFVPLTACPWRWGSNPSGPQRTQDLSTGRKTRARWAGGKSCLPLPTPMSAAGGQALAPGGVVALGGVGCVLMYPWRTSEGLCGGILCVCVHVCKRESLYVRVRVRGERTSE